VELLDLLLPQRCAVCDRPGESLCSPCRLALPRIAAPLCERCGAPTAWPVARCRECSDRRLAFASARAAVGYDRQTASFVSAWKERGIRTLASLAAELVVESVPPPRVAALTFIPADRERTLNRGHCPAERLARELAIRWELPLERALVRARDLPRQRELSRADRRKNVTGAFRASGPRLPRRVALVDDVYTTGSTVSSAASALRAAGAREVRVVTFARAIRAAS
jgi:ComF family protein